MAKSQFTSLSSQAPARHGTSASLRNRPRRMLLSVARSLRMEGNRDVRRLVAFAPKCRVIPLNWRALSSEGLSISLPKRLDGRSARMLCAVAFRPLLSVGDSGDIDGSATEARCLIADIEQRCRGAIVW